MMIASKESMLERIASTDDEHKLLAIAYTLEGGVKAGLIIPYYYAQCMVALAEKLGFGITTENLNAAAAKYL